MPLPGQAADTFRTAELQPGQPLGNLVQNVSLVADNTVVILNPKTAFLRITSDNATAANRTFTLTGGYLDGQILLLVCVANACELADSGNCNLSAAWQPDANDVLQLMWDYTSQVWREVSRSAN